MLVVCMIVFAVIAAQPPEARAETASTWSVCGSLHRAQSCVCIHRTPTPSPSQGVRVIAFILCSPEPLVMFRALNQTHLLSSYVRVSTRGFLMRGVSEMLRNVK